MKERIAGGLIGTALIFGGCLGNGASPSPSMSIENLVNCHSGPFEAEKIYKLENGRGVEIGGIKKDGNEDGVSVLSNGYGGFEISPVTNSFNATRPSKNETDLLDGSLFIVILSKDNNSKTEVEVFVTCTEIFPQNPQI
jgi:hypothetical protein